MAKDRFQPPASKPADPPPPDAGPAAALVPLSPLATIQPEVRLAMQTIEAISKAYGVRALARAGDFERAIVLAEGIESLRKAMTPAIMAKLMPLQGSRLGFKTDKDRPAKPDEKPGYPEDVVRDVLIEMMLRGLRPVGNEINIIGGNGYGTKEGFERLFGELDGVSDVRHQPGVPRMMPGGGGAVVDYVLEFKFDGQPRRIVRRGDTAIPVRVNAGMGVDAILGKARRKILKFAFDDVTQSAFTTPDGEMEDAPSAPSAVPAGGVTESLVGRLAERAQSLAPPGDPVADPPATPAPAPEPVGAAGQLFGGDNSTGPHGDRR